MEVRHNDGKAVAGRDSAGSVTELRADACPASLQPGNRFTRLQIYFFHFSWEVLRRYRFNTAPFLPRIDQVLVFWSIPSIRKSLPAALSPADGNQKPSKTDSKSNRFLYYCIFNMRPISKRLHLFSSSKIANWMNGSPSSQFGNQTQGEAIKELNVRAAKGRAAHSPPWHPARTLGPAPEHRCFRGKKKLPVHTGCSTSCFQMNTFPALKELSWKGQEAAGEGAQRS